jgi:DNA topoisomerase-1
MELRVEKSPFPAKVKDEAVATWIKPSLVAEVKFAEWTNKGELRQPVYLGLRSKAGEGRHARAGTTAKVAKRVEPTPRTRNELVHPPLMLWAEGVVSSVLPTARKRGMLRQTKEEDVAERVIEVASAIAEEGLRYMSDSAPGYRRKRTGTSFSYYDKDGKRIADRAIIRRIKSIGIPPAYEFVWICPSANGHIQATGVDARGRKQYRYHPKWRELRDQNKYEQIMKFAAALPALRSRVASDMKSDGLAREKVLATIVSLLEKTLIRVGNTEYAEKNKSYGLTTMRRKHVAIGRGVLRFEFTGKSGKRWKLQVEDKRIAGIVRRCAEIPGHELFKYLDDDGEPRTVDSGDVNEYIKEITQQDFSAKDFRTWAGTVLAALALAEFKKYDSQAEAKRNVVAAIEKVAKQLGNTPAICRKCYVHPEVLSAYMSGDLAEMIDAKIAQKFKRQYAKLTADEIMVLAFLRRRLEALKAPPVPKT